MLVQKNHLCVHDGEFPPPPPQLVLPFSIVTPGFNKHTSAQRDPLPPAHVATWLCQANGMRAQCSCGLLGCPPLLISGWNADAVTCLCVPHRGQPPGTADRVEGGGWVPNITLPCQPGSLTSASLHRTSYSSTLSKPLLTGALITAAEPVSWLIHSLPLVGSHWRKEVPGERLRAGEGVSSAAGAGRAGSQQGNAGTNNHPAGKTILRSISYSSCWRVGPT